MELFQHDPLVNKIFQTVGSESISGQDEYEVLHEKFEAIIRAGKIAEIYSGTRKEMRDVMLPSATK